MDADLSTSICRASRFRTLVVLAGLLVAMPVAATEADYDRVLPLSGIERYDGGPGAARATRASWRQLYHELRRAAVGPEGRPDLQVVEDRARRWARQGRIAIALVNDRYHRTAASGATVQGRAFSAASLAAHTYHGREVTFVLEPELIFSNAGERAAYTLDLDDGAGFRSIRPGEPVVARYRSPGTRTLRLRATGEGGVHEASFAFVVRALAAPAPHDTLHVTASVPYLGATAAGDAYLYLAPGRSEPVNPVVVIEGFDLDNTMGWDELYEQLNQENLIENLRAQGYDAVVLDFVDATDYLQRNAFVVTELLAQLESSLHPQTTIALAGASMGGLLGRYALAWLEAQGPGHRVRTFISFDAPHRGANIPLGIQYWMQFYAGQSADAAFLLSRLDRPAARQMLVYHYTDPPGTTGQADPLRPAFLADLAALGGYPDQPRLVAIANGSATAAGQGFAAGDQIIQWDYSDLFVAVRGNVWAVPATGSRTIFDGRIRILFSTSSRTVTVSGTLPYENAPGGSRATMTQMDETAAPYGDIIALHPSHCFIPTVSALDLDVPSLFHDVSADPDPLSHSPFDVLYAPIANQEHVAITPENAAWFQAEVALGITRVPQEPTAALRLAPSPNPSHGAPVRIALDLPRESRVDLRLFHVDGREVRRLHQGRVAAGSHAFVWDGRDAAGRAAAAGIYFLRLETEGSVETRRIVRLR